MLTVTTLNGATTVPITHYKDDEMYEEVLGDFTLSFASFFYARKHESRGRL